MDETCSVVSLTLDAEENFPTPRLSRTLLHFGKLAAADVVSQTLLLKLKTRVLLLDLYAAVVGVESCCHCCADAAVTDADAVDAAKVKIRH